MEFEKDILKQLQKAGWYSGRNVSEIYDDDKIKNYPISVKKFLWEFGNLSIEDTKRYESEVTNILFINPLYSYFEDDDDWEHVENFINSKLYPIGTINPDGYIIALDDSENVYMLGDYVFRIATNLKEGIEILLRDDWSNGFYELNEKTGDWVKNRKWNE